MDYLDAYIQYNGEEKSVFVQYDFPIPDELKGKVQEAIENGNALAACDFYEELQRIAEDKFSLSEYLDKEPDPSDYDTEEEYNEAKEEYEAEIDSYYLAGVTIADPNDKARLMDALEGLVFPDLEEGTNELEFEENDEVIARYTLTVEVDSDSHITEITDIEASAMEWDGVNSSSWSDEIYPNYDLIESELLDMAEEPDELDDDD